LQADQSDANSRGKKGLTWQGVVVAEDLEVLAVARGAAVGSHHPVERPVPATEPRQPDPDHHGLRS
jgi:hypothetical protein